jgi:tetratricopeptide (TPR) repeat protein
MPVGRACRLSTSLASALALALMMAAAPAFAAQQDSIDDASQPVVQAIPGAESMALNAALGRLGSNPRDLDALVDAGNAALGMGDVDAAVGFFSRADQIAPGNLRVRAGLAGALVRNQNPFDAIPMFDQAERAGAISNGLMADRGLAYDLVGDNETAQRYYRQVLSAGANDEVSRRLALSLAISGDKRGSDGVIAPLLQKQDKAAQRIRAFSLAILGNEQDSIAMAYAALPRDIAASISPYLRYMPKLTPAQQAAAANFGHFPRAAEIGHDDPRIAQYVRPRSAVAAADTALIPKGEPMGRSTRQSRADQAARDRQIRTDAARIAREARTPPPPVVAVRTAPPEPQPAREVAPTTILALATPKPLPAPVSVATPNPPELAVVTPAPVPIPATIVVPAVTAPTIVAATEPTSARPVVSSFDLAKVPASTSPTPVATPITAPAATPAVIVPATTPAVAPRNLADAFAEFAVPQADIAPTAGAVDMRRITPTRPAPEVKPPVVKTPPPPPSHPSRIWVQVATGRDKAALASDWRRMSRSAAEVFRGKKPSVSVWGQTKRLLAGPFESTAAANSFITQLRRADVDGAFVWSSPAGQVVDALDGK